jgi:hypothetical protein
VTRITDPCVQLPYSTLIAGWTMDKPVKNETIERLVRAGNAAGLTVDQMIHVLLDGMSVEELLQLIASRLPSTPITQSSSRWIM